MRQVHKNRLRCLVFISLASHSFRAPGPSSHKIIVLNSVGMLILHMSLSGTIRIPSFEHVYYHAMPAWYILAFRIDMSQ